MHYLSQLLLFFVRQWVRKLTNW